MCWTLIAHCCKITELQSKEEKEHIIYTCETLGLVSNFSFCNSKSSRRRSKNPTTNESKQEPNGLIVDCLEMYSRC